MQEEVLVWLEDIENAIAEINSFLPAKKDFIEFQKDVKTKRAIYWSIAVIGEAVKRIFF